MSTVSEMMKIMTRMVFDVLESDTNHASPEFHFMEDPEYTSGGIVNWGVHEHVKFAITASNDSHNLTILDGKNMTGVMVDVTREDVEDFVSALQNFLAHTKK